MRLCILTEDISISYNTICQNQLNMDYFIVLFLYTSFTLPHGGKRKDLNNEASKFYITSTDEYKKYLVENFNGFNSVKGCNISMARYFTSITLADLATTKHFSMVGTMRLDRIGISKEITSIERREEKSTVYTISK